MSNKPFSMRGKTYRQSYQPQNEGFFIKKEMFDKKYYSKVYREMHKEKYKQYRKKYNHSFKGKECRKKYNHSHKEKYKQYRKEHKHSHREEYRQYQKCWRQSIKGKAYIKNYLKIYYQTHRKEIRKTKRLWNSSLKGKMCRKRCNINRRLKTNDLTIKTIQSVYENNIKKFGTLTCYLCLKPIEFGQDSLEHKIPFSRGGNNARKNLDIACLYCNKSKYTKTEKEYKKREVKNAI